MPIVNYSPRHTDYKMLHFQLNSHKLNCQLKFFRYFLVFENSFSKTYTFSFISSYYKGVTNVSSGYL